MKEMDKNRIEWEKASLGIELGSTRIKAVLIDAEHQVLASGSHQWENRFEHQIWTYRIEDIRQGVQACYQDLKEEVKNKYGVVLKRVGSIGISAMMHGYMVFDAEGKILVPFRTWRNTMTEEAAGILVEQFGYPIPQRWSIAHLYQAILKEEPHVKDIFYMTTLDGYIHWMLTGKKVLGIGQASGMFPIDCRTKDFDERMLDQFRELIRERKYPWDIREILPQVLCAGEEAGTLTKEGARFLDAEGDLESGIPMCPPEGDAGTGMVATNSVKKGTGNVSAGTSIFAMAVLEKPLSKPYDELDLVTTPDGELVAMVHCNNCTSEINQWMNIFQEVLEEFGKNVDSGELFKVLFTKALEGEKDGGNLLIYPYLSGEHITGVRLGCSTFLRQPESRFTLANFMRAQLYATAATLKIGMDFLTENENVTLKHLVGHGGFFKTAGVGEKMMADMLGIPVVVMENAGEGGAWGMAILASYLQQEKYMELPDFLDGDVFKESKKRYSFPDEIDQQGTAKFIERYKAGLEIERQASEIMGR